MAVWRRSSSALATAPASALSTKMNSLSGLPSSGVITRSASAKISATIGSPARGGSKMFKYCRPLAGIQEHNLGRGTVAAEDALRAQGFPYRWLTGRLTGRERLECGARFLCQFGGVSVVDSHAFGRTQVCFSRYSRSRCAARLGLALHHA